MKTEVYRNQAATHSLTSFLRTIKPMDLANMWANLQDSLILRVFHSNEKRPHRCSPANIKTHKPSKIRGFYWANSYIIAFAILWDK